MAAPERYDLPHSLSSLEKNLELGRIERVNSAREVR